ncbi:MAG: FAD-dependent oxidoreductase [Chloroflexi bacterium]|nr:FAD-dependent oxidoreductase [Chloroflexota bacterium]
MSYPAEMKESIAKVEASRPARQHQAFPKLDPQEREDILRTYHPDYISGAFREIRVGPNKGDRAPHELANALEAEPLLIRDGFSLKKIVQQEPDAKCDVLVIGGGGAGASAALLAQENGAEVLISTKLRFGDANTMMAQGGIQAADKDNDSPALHYLDVMGGGAFACDPDLVEALVMDAPKVIAWLESLGVMFDKEPDGTMRTIHGGGTSRKRMHAARDYTGAEIMRVLRDEVRSRAGEPIPIRVWEFRPAVELLLDEKNRIAGAVLKDLDTSRLMIVHARAVIIASGGSGRLHYQGFPTTNHYGATGDGLVLAYRVGARLSFIDTMQYHPTGAAYPEQILGQLVTEKVRGLGAQVCNADGEQFVYPLETRDVEAAAFIRECTERSKGVVTSTGQMGVWLDAPLIDLLRGPGTIAAELPAMVRQFNRFGIDLAHEPILVYPTLHYQNGGVSIRPDAGTSIPGLFVAGEASGGIHGRNRLMGNSLLDICVFGRRAGMAAALLAKDIAPGNPHLAHLDEWEHLRREAGLEEGQASPILLPDYTRKTSLVLLRHPSIEEEVAGHFKSN